MKSLHKVAERKTTRYMIIVEKMFLKFYLVDIYKDRLSDVRGVSPHPNRAFNNIIKLWYTSE